MIPQYAILKPKTILKDFFTTLLQFQSCSRPVPQSSWLPYTCIDQLSQALKDMKQDSHHDRVRVPLSQQFSSYKRHDASWYTRIILSGNCLPVLVLLLKICIWLYNLNLIFIKCFSWIFIKCVSRGYENDVAALYMTASTDTSCVLLCFSWLKCWSTSWLSTSRKGDTSPNRFWRNNWHFLFLHSISLHAIKFFLSCRNTLFHVIEC